MADLPELGTLEHPEIAALVLNIDSGVKRGKRRVFGGVKLSGMSYT